MILGDFGLMSVKALQRRLTGGPQAQAVAATPPPAPATGMHTLITNMLNPSGPATPVQPLPSTTPTASGACPPGTYQGPNGCVPVGVTSSMIVPSANIADPVCGPGQVLINKGTRSAYCYSKSTADFVPNTAQPPAVPTIPDTSVRAVMDQVNQQPSSQPSSQPAINITVSAPSPASAPPPPDDTSVTSPSNLAVTQAINTGAAPSAPTKSMGAAVTPLAAAGAGFLVGGPIGAVVGGLVGYFISKK